MKWTVKCVDSLSEGEVLKTWCSHDVNEDVLPSLSQAVFIEYLNNIQMTMDRFTIEYYFVDKPPPPKELPPSEVGGQPGKCCILPNKHLCLSTVHFTLVIQTKLLAIIGWVFQRKNPSFKMVISGELAFSSSGVWLTFLLNCSIFFILQSVAFIFCRMLK